ncbi:MAG: sulfite exporter TauE/SafE family protein, partial [Gammaproteobacteria bacterium]
MQLLIAFNLGLFSTLHCLGMCGGILSALMFLSEESNASQKRLALNFGYNIGRII